MKALFLFLPPVLPALSTACSTTGKPAGSKTENIAAANSSKHLPLCIGQHPLTLPDAVKTAVEKRLPERD